MGTAINQERLFADLNESRVAFKHHGRLPDAQSTYHIAGDTLQTLDQICAVLIGTSLLQIDQTEAILDMNAKAHFGFAKTAITNEDYKSAMEETSAALFHIFWHIPGVSSSITPGVVSTEDALLLSGRGVDPASFLGMQRLLPRCDWPEETHWETREFGHPGNWTRANADFCLSTAIDTAIRLQHGGQASEALHFYDIYEDILIIKSDGCPSYIVEGAGILPSYREKMFSGFKEGDVIGCKATGHLLRTGDLSPKDEIPFDIAEWVAGYQPRCGRLNGEIQDDGTATIWLKANDVTISYREMPNPKFYRR
jgi:hypothetical protein